MLLRAVSLHVEFDVVGATTRRCGGGHRSVLRDANRWKQSGQNSENDFHNITSRRTSLFENLDEWGQVPRLIDEIEHGAVRYGHSVGAKVAGSIRVNG